MKRIIVSTCERALRALLGLIASVPMSVMHTLARPTAFLLYRVFRYRVATVRENLQHAFPDMTKDQRLKIEKDSYRHLANLFFEVLCSTRMSRTELYNRVSFTNVALLQRATDNWEKQAIVMSIHQGNWEWLLNGAMLHLPVPVDAVYKELHSPFWESFMLEARTRFGAEPMALSDVARTVIRGRKKKRLIAMIADQSGPREGGYWTEYLNRPASFHRGAEKLARTLDLPVFYVQCRRLRTGYYEMEFQELSLAPKSDGEKILERFVHKTEQSIIEQPSTYLWSNRRWKKKPLAVNTDADPVVS